MLADDLEPLVLADGRKIDPATGKVIKEQRSSAFVEVPAPSVAQDIVVRARKSVADLPAAPEQMTGVGLVAFYTLFGLDDVSISIAIGNRLTVDQIKNVRKLEVYKQFMDEARTSLLAAEQDSVREVLTKHSMKAAERIVTLSDSDNDVLSFKASQDILDRTGHRPADIVEHRHSMENALNIVFIKRDANEQLPFIDAEIVNAD